MKTAEEIFLHELKDYINSGISKNDLKTLINQRLKSIPAEPSDLKLSEEDIRIYLQDMKKHHQQITTKNRLEWYISGVEEGLRKHPVLLKSKASSNIPTPMPSDLNERIAYHKETLSDFDTVMAKYDIEGNKELRTAYFDLKQSYAVLLNSFESKLKV